MSATNSDIYIHSFNIQAVAQVYSVLCVCRHQYVYYYIQYSGEFLVCSTVAE